MPDLLDLLKVDKKREREESPPPKPRKEEPPAPQREPTDEPARHNAELLHEVGIVDKTPDSLIRLIEPQKETKETVVYEKMGVRIVDVGKDYIVYKINLPYLTVSDKAIIDTVQRLATRLIDIRKESSDATERKESLKRKIKELIQKSPSLNIPKTKVDVYADIISREMGGYGLIDYLIDDQDLEEIMVVPPKRDVYVFHRKYGMLTTNIILDSDEYVRNIIERIARDVNRRIDFNYPLLDARLPTGDRVNATLQPTSVDGPTLTIRKFRENPYTMIDMINFETLDPKTAAFLWVAAEGLHARPSNILVAGGTGSGKTTFLNCLSMFIRPTERVVSIEDTAELKLPLSHWVRMETRPPSIEGTGEITMDVLLKNALRMRPDRIIVGEVRHAEAFTLFTAMNTGHQGSMGTIHANSVDETITRLMSPPMNVPEQMATTLDLILILNKINAGKKGTIRRLTEIAEVTGTRKPELNLTHKWNASEDAIYETGTIIQLKKKIAAFAGASINEIDDEIETRSSLLSAAKEKGIRDIERFALFVHKYYAKHGN